MFDIKLLNLEKAILNSGVSLYIARDYKNARKIILVQENEYLITYTSHTLTSLLNKANMLFGAGKTEDYEIDIGYVADDNALDIFIKDGFLLLTKYKQEFMLDLNVFDENDESTLFKSFTGSSICEVLNKACESLNEITHNPILTD